MTVSSLEAVLAYVGSTGSTSISFILPGLFYYKISSPDSPLNQKLIKEEDDYDWEGDDDSGSTKSDDDGTNDEHQDGEGHGLLANSGLLSISAVSLLKRTKNFRRKTLRQLSLALAIYGICVMIVCLAVNIFFHASH